MHPVDGAVVRFRRGVFRFDDEDPQGSPTPARYSADILRIRQDDTLRGGDPLVVLYEKRWPDSFDDGLPSELATTAADLGRFIGSTWSFKDAVERAHNGDQLAKAGTGYLERLGPIGANLLMTVAAAAAGLVGEAGARAAGARALAAPAGGLAVASGEGPTLPMTIVRVIQRGEKIEDLVNEGKALTWETGNEHAVVKLANGQRALVSGGPGGIEFAKDEILAIFGHSHPTPAPPSSADFEAPETLGQSQQTVFHGRMRTKIRPKPRC